MRVRSRAEFSRPGRAVEEPASLSVYTNTVPSYNNVMNRLQQTSMGPPKSVAKGGSLLASVRESGAADATTGASCSYVPTSTAASTRPGLNRSGYELASSSSSSTSCTIGAEDAPT
eukprot:c6896_g1_i1 orf=164-511(+)